jgi:DNA-binding transcriptional LysR family regulator
VLLDRVTDLIDEGLDVAVRIAALPDSALSAVRVGAVRRVVCASPGYLKATGTPRKPADLSRHDAIAFSPPLGGQPWIFPVGGRAVTAEPRTRLIVNDAEVAIAAAVAGRGMTRVLSYQIAPELKAGKLSIVLDDYEPPPLPVHLVHLEGRHANARVRAFIEFAAERLRSALG